jgi:hypothetical protein
VRALILESWVSAEGFHRVSPLHSMMRFIAPMVLCVAYLVYQRKRTRTFGDESLSIRFMVSVSGR